MLDPKYNHIERNSWNAFKDGYPIKSFKQHQLIWMLEYGELPEPPFSIDHINGDPTDNRLENLRIADPYQQSINRPTKGAVQFIGVSRAGREKYQVAFKPRNEEGGRGKRKSLGHYDTIIEAALGRDVGALSYLSEEDKPFLRLNFPELRSRYMEFLKHEDCFQSNKTVTRFSVFANMVKS